MKQKVSQEHCTYQLGGWVLFIFSALFFITSSIRAGDMLSLMGGLLFLFACFVFLIPLIARKRPGTDADTQDLSLETSNRN